MASLIEATLFDYITEYAADIEASRVNVSDAIRGDDVLLIFAENFVAQFSKNFLRRDIVGFTSRSKVEMTSARRKLQKSPRSLKAQSLMFHLEPLFSLVPELSYGNSEDDAQAFRLEYFHELLQKIVDWLSEEESEAAALAAAEESLRVYEKAMGL
ncbi:hypothetical protein [Pedococcus sp. 5OH_020]|uniref:hypothetical protein n=1 Tax=Pedococcus sp. 5OH_020 TaxID=2989814 RepID=UPI0022E9E2EE|nr:hypothetical protein [Pedococcus sp. 5OH_020]